MRIRNIKPEFYRSHDIDELDWHTRLVFIGLWSYVDDNGVGVDKLSSITADLFSHDLSVDPTETLRRVSAALEALAMRNLLVRYRASGKHYLYITGWAAHQRVHNPNKPRFPLPTSENVDPPEGLGTSSGESPETLGTGSVGQWVSGSENSSSEPDGSDPDDHREDVEKVCQHLKDRIVGNGCKEPTITKAWRTSARLLIDRDKRTVSQIITAIDWCQDDEFWRGNILSMPKLREKYDQLRLAAQKSKPPAKPERLTFGGGDRPSWEM